MWRGHEWMRNFRIESKLVTREELRHLERIYIYGVMRCVGPCSRTRGHRVRVNFRIVLLMFISFGPWRGATVPISSRGGGLF